MLNTILALLVLAPLLGIGLFLRYQKQQHNKRLDYPFWENESMRRPPGAYIGQKLVTQTHEAMSDITQLCLVSVVLSLLIYTQAFSSEMMTILILLWGAWFIYIMLKLAKLQKNIRNNRLGYECELVVGQELNLLMLEGWHVFHDLQMGDFNIDHILVGTGGVFAVETKGRSKPRLNGQKMYEITYRDGILYFPHPYKDKKITKQAKYQSKAASDWLTQAIGQDVPVHPVVVLPGWYIKREGTEDVPVRARGEINQYFIRQKNQALSHERIEQVVHQIEQKVKDLTPRELTDPRSYK